MAKREGITGFRSRTGRDGERQREECVSRTRRRRRRSSESIKGLRGLATTCQIEKEGKKKWKKNQQALNSTLEIPAGSCA